MWETYRMSEEKEQRERIEREQEKHKPSGNIFNGIMAQANDKSLILSFNQYWLSIAFVPNMVQLACTSSWKPTVLLPFQLLIHWCHIGSLKVPMVGMFTHSNQQMLQIRVLLFWRVWIFFFFFSLQRVGLHVHHWPATIFWNTAAN